MDPTAFLMDPTAFRNQDQPQAEVEATAVLLDADTLQRFLNHLAGKDSDKAEARSEKYRKNVKSYLNWWARALKGRDFRQLKLTQRLQGRARHREDRPEAQDHRHQVVLLVVGPNWGA